MTKQTFAEIISWEFPKGHEVAYSHLKTCLLAAGFPEELARAFIPDHAFRRAVKTLSRKKLVRGIKSDDDHIHFQFTREDKIGLTLDYVKEARVSLDKKSGTVSCPESATLAHEASVELNRCLEARNAGDLNRIVTQILQAQSDIWQFKARASVYLIAGDHTALLENTSLLVRSLGGQMQRVSLSEDEGETRTSVREVVKKGINSLIEEHEALVDKFSTETRGDTIARAAERLEETKMKIEGYALLLEAGKEELEKRLKASRRKLRDKVLAIGKEDKAPLFENASDRGELAGVA